MTIIRDPIHGNINLDPEVKNIIDTPVFQRLRYIKQLGFAYLVYPGANHTRFEHCLGTYALTKQILTINNESNKPMELAALLHDIGHGPLSHTLESQFVKQYSLDHEQFGERLIKEIKDKFQTTTATEVLREYRKQDSILTGDIGTDRMDYLARDAYYTGVTFGHVDIIRLASVIQTSPLALRFKGIQAAESLIMARYLMFSSVYFHKTNKIAGKMIARVVSDFLKNEKPDEVLKMNDYQFLYSLREFGELENKMVTRVLNRNLYKVQTYIGWHDLTEEQRERVSSEKIDTNAIEEYIMDTQKLEPHEFIIFGTRNVFKPINILVVDGTTHQLRDLSHIVAEIEHAQKLKWFFIVAADKKFDIKKDILEMI